MADQNDEVYLKQIFSPIVGFFGAIVKLLYQAIQFIKSKIVVFLGLVILGIIGGYFLDRNSGNEIINQEIIIKPNVKSTRFIYNFVNSIPYRLNDEQYLKSIGLQEDWIDNIGKVKISPITAIEDIFDHLHKKYQDRNFQYTIQDFSEKELARDKFTYIYTYHLVEISFHKQEDYNQEITRTLLKNLSSNDHYQKLANLDVKQAEEAVQYNKTSLRFIDRYLQGILENDDESNTDNEIVVVSDESKTNKLADLLEQKNRIIYTIKEDEKTIDLRNQVFSVASDSGVVVRKKPIHKRNIILVPLALCSIVGLAFGLLYVFRQMEKFVKKSN